MQGQGGEAYFDLSPTNGLEGAKVLAHELEADEIRRVLHLGEIQVARSDSIHIQHIAVTIGA